MGQTPRNAAAGHRNMLSKHTNHWYIKTGLDTCVRRQRLWDQNGDLSCGGILAHRNSKKIAGEPEILRRACCVAVLNLMIVRNRAKVGRCQLHAH
jgi:hypothetical protein